MTKTEFSSGDRSRVPAGFNLSDIPDFDFVTKVEFSSRGLGGASAERYLIAWHSPILLTKIALTFARAASGDVARNWLVGLTLLLSRTMFCPPVYVSFSRNYPSFGTMYRSARSGLALVFCGNMCAFPSV